MTLRSLVRRTLNRTEKAVTPDGILDQAQPHPRIEFAELLLQGSARFLVRSVLQSLGFGIQLVGQCLEPRFRVGQVLNRVGPLMCNTKAALMASWRAVSASSNARGSAASSGSRASISP